MEVKGIMGGVHTISVRIMNLAYWNLLWIGFTLLGAVILGVLPATVALYTVMKKDIRAEKDAPSDFKVFRKAYSSNFFRANGLGILLFIGGGLLYTYFHNLHVIQDSYAIVFHILLYMLAIIYAMIMLFIFPAYVSYGNSVFQYIKNAVIIGLSYPHYVILMAFILSVIFTILLISSALLLFFGISVLAYINMKISAKVFYLIEQRQSHLQVQSAK